MSDGPVGMIHMIEDSRLSLHGLPAELARRVQRALPLRNPAYDAALQFAGSDAGIPKDLEYYRRSGDGALIVPRGAESIVVQMIEDAGYRCSIENRSCLLPAVSFSPAMQLGAAQRSAVASVLASPKGQLVAPPGAGKTTMALALIARRRQPTLWLTHTRVLAAQARDRAATDLQLDPDEIGMIGGGAWTVGKRLTIAMIQTLARGIDPRFVRSFGQVIMDECHHVPAAQMATVVSQFPARYLLGLSATPYRRDGLGPVIQFYLGSVTGRIGAAALPDRLVKPKIIPCETGISVHGDRFSDIVTRLCENPLRNARIVAVVAAACRKGRKSLVLTDRVDHAELLAALLHARGIAVAVLHGKKHRAERETARDLLNAGAVSVVVATGQLIGEGFDCPKLDTLFLASPISYHGRLTQYLGRVSRTAPGKRDAVVVDFLDGHPMLWAQWRKRRETYDALGLVRLQAGNTAA